MKVENYELSEHLIDVRDDLARLQLKGFKISVNEQTLLNLINDLLRHSLPMPGPWPKNIKDNLKEAESLLASKERIEKEKQEAFEKAIQLDKLKDKKRLHNSVQFRKEKIASLEAIQETVTQQDDIDLTSERLAILTDKVIDLASSLGYKDHLDLVKSVLLGQNADTHCIKLVNEYLVCFGLLSQLQTTEDKLSDQTQT